MGLSERGLKYMCDYFIVSKLSCIKIDNKYLYYEKENYDRLHEFTHKDDFLFDLYQTNVLDYVYGMLVNVCVRGGKETTEVVLGYGQSQIKKKYKLHIKNDEVGSIVTSLTQNTKTILNWLVSKK